jgi:hypothetical protein
MEINGFCLEWHKKFSPAFNEFLVKPLSELIKIKLTPWDGNKILGKPILKEPTIFCQNPPPANWLNEEEARIVWVPMWDDFSTIPQSYLNKMPKKNIRVLAYSQYVYQRSMDAGLNSLLVKYFINPNLLPIKEFNRDRILFYWNRRGLIGPEFIAKFCKVLEISKLIFLSKVDPGVDPSYSYYLPGKFGKTTIEQYTNFLPHEEYLKLLNQSNIFIAPRLSEGVGLTFLEALARGCAVFALDFPTMNEYICHKKTGYLFPFSKTQLIHLLFRAGRFTKRRINKLFMSKYILSHASSYQNWQDIELLNLDEIGNQAKIYQSNGFIQWTNSLKNISNFICNW